uniref:Uncharacterized protein n=1 Tax=Alexandrium monilatum TaxID=311494 RepID=A0A7S4V4L4_9DINO
MVHKGGAADVAGEVGCTPELAEAALSVCGGDSARAARLLRDGPREVHSSSAQGRPGDARGDAQFRHPYVQCLLHLAREKLAKALAEQSGPEEDRFLICVRTYGRPGRSMLWRVLRAALPNRGAVADVESRLRMSGVDDLASLRSALQDYGDLIKRIQDAGQGTLRRKTLEALRAETEKPPKCLLELGLKNAERGLRQLTLASLERALGTSLALKRCFIFVSHEDKDVLSGRYGETLAGTGWEDRIVQGVKGADLQVRFIEEAAPLGAHVIVADDNIESLVVEEPLQTAVTQNQQGRWDCFRRGLHHEASMDGLQGTGLELLEEPEVHRLLRAALVKWKVERLEAMTGALVQLGIDTVCKLRSKLPKLNELLVEAGAAKLRPRETEAVRSALQKPLPPRLLLAKPPATVQQLGARGARTDRQRLEPELVQLIGRAAREMRQRGANLWSVNCTQNHYFLRAYGQAVRARAVKRHVFQDFQTSLGLVYGAFFGFRVLHEAERYSRFGQVKDDVERTLRYWHLDGIVLRFGRYAVVKTHKPGCFGGRKGGISASLSAEGHAAEGMKALEAILGFAQPYVRLAKPGEKNSCGLVWGASEPEPRKASVQAAEVRRRLRGKTAPRAAGANRGQPRPRARPRWAAQALQSAKRRRLDGKTGIP